MISLEFAHLKGKGLMTKMYYFGMIALQHQYIFDFDNLLIFLIFLFLFDQDFTNSNQSLYKFNILF